MMMKSKIDQQMTNARPTTPRITSECLKSRQILPITMIPLSMQSMSVPQNNEILRVMFVDCCRLFVFTQWILQVLIIFSVFLL